MQQWLPLRATEASQNKGRGRCEKFQTSSTARRGDARACTKFHTRKIKHIGTVPSGFPGQYGKRIGLKWPGIKIRPVRGANRMRWVAPSEKDLASATLEKRLWHAADQFRANSGLRSQEYSAPVLGLIFLRFAEVRFAAQRAKLQKAEVSSRRGSRVDEPAAYHAEGILYLPRRGALRLSAEPARGRGHRRQSQRSDARHREAQPAARRRAAQDLQSRRRWF